MGRTLWIALLVVVVGVAGTAWWLHHRLDGMIASAVRTYVPPIVGAKVQLDGVKIQPTEGVASLNGLVVGNPKGFKTPRALAVGKVSLQLDVASLTKELIYVREIRVEGPELTYEHAAGGSNLEVIQRHVESYIAAVSSGGPSEGPRSPSKKLVIDHFIIQGAKANVSADWLQGNAVGVPLADIHLVDLGKKTNGITPAEVARQVVKALTQNATKAMAPLKFGGTVVQGVKKGAASAGDAVKNFFK